MPFSIAKSGTSVYKNLMEVDSINKIQTANKITKKTPVQSAKIEDTLSISIEAQKKAEWVKLLQQMPDMRPEKIEGALSSDIFSCPAKVFAEIARQILNG